MSALAHCHARRIIHRDLKPSNILIDATGENIKVADWGLSRIAPPDQNLTGDVTTAWYCAPEILLGAKNYSCAVDIWSAGCIFIVSSLPTPAPSPIHPSVRPSLYPFVTFRLPTCPPVRSRSSLHSFFLALLVPPPPSCLRDRQRQLSARVSGKLLERMRLAADGLLLCCRW
jgi:serine/threonine protein kinase